jgi:hypothetical protein
MNLHFITSLSKEYWESVGKHCIGTWNLPGKVTVYLEQTTGPIKWVNDIPFNVELLTVPPLTTSDDTERRKVLKFWGKSVAQISAVTNRANNERIIWIDSDIEQVSSVDKRLFDFKFDQPVAVMNSHDGDDCWESGIVIFNQENEKLNQFIKKYSHAWTDPEILNNLWKPYDAQVLGYVALSRGYYNLCENRCTNAESLNNSRYRHCFKHWINKTNKEKLILQKTNENNHLPQISS